MGRQADLCASAVGRLAGLGPVRFAAWLMMACLVLTGSVARAATEGTALSAGVAAMAEAAPVDPAAPAIVELLVPLRLDGFVLGEVTVQLPEGGEVEVQASEVARLLAPLASEALVSALQALADPSGWIGPGAARTIGVGLTFDPARLDLVITVPATARRSQTVAVAPEGPRSGGAFDPPARLSAAANIYLTADVTRQESVTGVRETSTLSGQIGLQGRVGPVAWQSIHALRTDGRVARTGSRLILDDPARALRWQLGDIRPFADSVAGGADLLGLGVSREVEALQPDRASRVRTPQSFVIEEASEVTVLVNGRVILRRDFDPGNYDLTDFPLVFGRNDVELVVRARSGRREVLRFNQYLDSRLLQPGQTDFGVAAGVLADRTGQGEPSYRSGAAGIQGFVLHGVSRQLSIGLSGRADTDGQALIGTATRAGRIGVVSARLGVDEVQGLGRAAFAGAGWVLALPSRDEGLGGRTLRLSADVRDATGQGGRVETSLSASYAWPLSRTISASIDVRGTPGRRSASVQTNWAMGRDLRLSTSVSWREDRRRGTGRANRSQTGLMVYLSRTLGRTGQVRASYDTMPRETRVSWFGGSSPDGRGWSQAAELARDPDGWQADLTVSGETNRATLMLTGGASSTPFGDTQRGALRVGTALAFADGALAWGRPVGEAFVILAPHASLEGRPVRLEAADRGAGPYPASGRLGPALVGGLSAFSAQTIRFGVEDLPDGYDLGRASLRINPGLFAGYRVVAGSASARTVTAIARTGAGQPAALLAGTATRLDLAGRAPVTVFTTRDGRFSLSGIEPGRWQVTLGPGQARWQFDLPERSAPMTDLGTLEEVP